MLGTIIIAVTTSIVTACITSCITSRICIKMFVKKIESSDEKFLYGIANIVMQTGWLPEKIHGHKE